MKNFPKIICGLAIVIVIICLFVFIGGSDNKQSQPNNVVQNKNDISLDNKFKYSAYNNVDVAVIEFDNGLGQDCIAVHTSYYYKDSQANLSCVNKYKKNKMLTKTHIVKQLNYTVGKSATQITTLITRKSHTCTIVHPNYYFTDSVASISCVT